MVLVETKASGSEDKSWAVSGPCVPLTHKRWRLVLVFAFVLFYFVFRGKLSLCNLG